MEASIFRFPSPALPAAGILLLLAALLPAAGGGAPEDSVVRRGPFRLELVEMGEVRAVRSRSVVAPMEWRNDLQIIRLVPEGVLAAEGDTLVQLDAGFVEQALEQARRDLENSRAELRRIEAEQSSRRLGLQNAVQNARFRREQAELQLTKLGFESQARREEARLSLEMAGVGLEKALAELKAQATLDSLELAKAQLSIGEAEGRIEAENRQIASMTLRAPGPGLVVHAEIGDEATRKIQLGDVVPPASTLVEIPDLSQMELRFSVHEVDWSRIEVGQPVEIRLEAYPDRVFNGRVSAVDRLALPPESGSQARTFGAQADIDGSDPLLKPGMTAQVRVLLLEKEDVLLVERRALFQMGERTIVYPRSQWPTPRVVETGELGPLQAEIRAGVEEGERLVTTPPPTERAPREGVS